MCVCVCVCVCVFESVRVRVCVCVCVRLSLSLSLCLSLSLSFFLSLCAAYVSCHIFAMTAVMYDFVSFTLPHTRIIRKLTKQLTV